MYICELRISGKKKNRNIYIQIGIEQFDVLILFIFNKSSYSSYYISILLRSFVSSGRSYCFLTVLYYHYISPFFARSNPTSSASPVLTKPPASTTTSAAIDLKVH